MNNLFKVAAVVLTLSLSSGFSIDSKSDLRISSEKGFIERWHDFQGDSKQFPLWTSDWKEEELKSRFDQMTEERWGVYFVNPEDCRKKDAVGRYKEIYQTPENWKVWGSRYPYPGAFSYNLASTSYNSSLIILHGKQFLALEAPAKENLSCFCQVLNQHKVTDLVRLTPAVFGGRECSFPYWEGHINIHPKSGRPTILLGDREMNYFFTDSWVDHKGMEPKRLIALVKAIKENEGSDQMIAVHCRAGVGRTGTLLAAYTLMRDIDEQVAKGVAVDQIQVSIDKLVWELSIQRPFMVTHFDQYLCLYQFVSTYAEMLKKQ